ncbi:MaoC family dehydratase N-terminal domain-containing protein [Streptomyces sp. TRM S81-3]|uniref:MaoC family dehydratase N-terminal domain-containing protein n=1 Tax=Streptomyces griseicoloratus TaxID=2752516 RepID=A0A926QPE7_9ACTN|nr:MaoC/PaaZ C-terminal domain-containing protein [Streptomyces griseicoloratus]MBD0418646.1 MaoC family dehydratase N-terminal domain-containing protein [Streptomyces griseicoloratus]
MPIDVHALLAAPPVRTDVVWDDRDVRLYHLALGAGVPETDPDELRYVYERHPRGLKVLPLFGVVAAGVGFQVFDRPGVDIDLARVLHGGQEVTVHRPLPPAAKATAVTRVTDVHDKGMAAVIVQESALLDETGEPLLTQRNHVFVRGEGGFGGDRGPSGRMPDPDGEPERVFELPTLPQQALLYRLTGDWNPLHADPDAARAAGYDRPVLHGLCTFGAVVKAVTDRFLGGDTSAIAGCRTRFAGVFLPGETLRISVWTDPDPATRGYRLRATAAERGDAPVLTDAALTVR